MSDAARVTSILERLVSRRAVKIQPLPLGLFCRGFRRSGFYFWFRLTEEIEPLARRSLCWSTVALGKFIQTHASVRNAIDAFLEKLETEKNRAADVDSPPTAESEDPRTRV